LSKDKIDKQITLDESDLDLIHIAYPLRAITEIVQRNEKLHLLVGLSETPTDEFMFAVGELMGSIDRIFGDPSKPI